MSLFHPIDNLFCTCFHTLRFDPTIPFSIFDSTLRLPEPSREPMHRAHNSATSPYYESGISKLPCVAMARWHISAYEIRLSFLYRSLFAFFWTMWISFTSPAERILYKYACFQNKHVTCIYRLWGTLSPPSLRFGVPSTQPLLN
jgi:hypothetical protein